MLPTIERGRLNEQVLIAPVLRTPAPSWPPGINRCDKQRGQYRGQILSAKLMERLIIKYGESPGGGATRSRSRKFKIPGCSIKRHR